MADALKAEGNKAFSAKDYTTAIDKFTQAIEIEPQNHVLYSNRSAVYAATHDYQKALDDANKATEIKPDWAKGWSRKGAAARGLGDLLAAHDAYEEALKLEPTNDQFKASFNAVKRAIDAEAKADGFQGDTGGLGSMFNDPNLIQKLANNPKTAPLLADHEFMTKLQKLKDNPNSIGAELGDPRFLQVMSVLLGIDMQFGAPPGAGGPSGATEAEEDVPMPDARPKPTETKKEPEPEPEPEDEETIAKKKAQEAGDAEKKIGNDFYKKKQFAEAIEHYQKAWELNKDVTYLNNIGAAKFESGDYKGAIEICEEAVQEGREHRTDFKTIAKSFARIGSAYEKLGDLTQAIEYYNRSLTEHRTADVLTKLRAVEKAKIKAEKDAYISPEEAEKARELGQKKFQEADWPGAVDAFTEMTKRAPDDPRGFSNRAAALIKLMAFPQAVQDCDEAIKRDASFIRAYIRKAQALQAMKEYSKALDALTEASTHDTTGKNAREIEQQQNKILEAQYSARAGETEEQTAARIQNDPEIMSILQDPIMQTILQQAKSDPAALQEHMKNAQVRSQIQKLIAAGVIRLGR
ncbi:heat shock protein (Sti1), putative [Talaromyces stipitatus ATCC 10500]|uniref:Heat shock protein (Sti1), putative n=1 Tax=Talaromyces stipitatus (strain ATCC 10500 / CBS 375.48 / QM 6759 / NRRL 1006) TaxID=441959 RepID=B8M1B1_TALSN|nr:heat shock protein (Sti1), putative [Talaromyces stipitatus ATCC 10500]EED21807.1 heat shock protein (Sti1), putative [Talaromyces stipitatus ATCC 10500]